MSMLFVLGLLLTLQLVLTVFCVVGLLYADRKYYVVDLFYAGLCSGVPVLALYIADGWVAKIGVFFYCIYVALKVDTLLRDIDTALQKSNTRPSFFVPTQRKCR